VAQIKKDIRFRVYLSFIGMVIFGILIIGRAIALQVVSGKKLKEYATKEHTRLAEIESERGNIYSADGSLLSSSIPVFDIRLDVSAVQKDSFEKNVKALSIQLAKLFSDKSANEYEDILVEQRKVGSKYFLLKRKVSYKDYLAMRNMPIFKYGRNKGGFIAEDFNERKNPFGLLGNRMIGMHRDNAQSVGLEAKYNKYLLGKQGQRVERKIAGGTWMPIDGSELDPENGKDILTTIDVNTQDIAENALLDVLTKEQATYGTCIVMETKTGAIKAMANLGKNVDGTYGEILNYALMPIEPGSTFKINALLSAFEDGFATLTDNINAGGGTAYFGNQRMSDSHLGTGTVSIKEAFAKSSNVGCAKLIFNNYTKNPTAYVKHLKDLQIDRLTDIDLMGERKPGFSKPPTELFKNISALAWLAIGYEVKVSPLRTCMVYNTIANNGVMMKPYIVSEVRDYNTTIKKFEPTIVAQNIFKPSTIAAAKEATFAVVQEGTGKALKNDVYTVCGKTGTALVADKGITYADHVYHGSFVGFFPKEDPLYTICVVVRTRKGANTYYGGQIALPVFKAVADRLYANSIKTHKPLQVDTNIANLKTYIKGTYGTNMQIISKSLKGFSNNINAHNWYTTILDSNGKSSFIAVNVVNKVVPNVNGMGLRAAIQVLEKCGLNVQANGKGKVTNQSIAPGTIIKIGTYINVNLS
jgi:cell division protein FtsI (penicillin-binding protein 3)